MRATLGAELFHVSLSSRWSPVAENAVPLSTTRWPTTSLGGAASMETLAAGPGTILTSTTSVTGRVPGTRATTVTGMVPVEPDRTRPVVSTRPSNRAPPDWMYRKRTFSTGRPLASSAWALSCSVSRAAMTGFAGVTTSLAMGDGGSCAAACWAGVCAWSTATTRTVKTLMGGLGGRGTGGASQLWQWVAPHASKAGVRLPS
jgi:hypothetical protein